MARYQTSKDFFVSMVGSDEKHHGHDVIDALDRITRPSEMRQFHTGYIDWFVSGNYKRPEATEKVRTIISKYVKDLSLWKRFLWWWTCGIK